MSGPGKTVIKRLAASIYQRQAIVFEWGKKKSCRAGFLGRGNGYEKIQFGFLLLQYQFITASTSRGGRANINTVNAGKY